MTKQTLFKYVLPIFLSAMLLFSALPVSASANDESTNEVASEIVREVTELREESVKHFLCEDGSYIAVSYAEPVHYEENGEWKEIDNTLVLSNENTYVPRASNREVSIPQSFSGGKQITATNKGHTISFGVASGNKKVALSKTAAVKAVEALPSSIAAEGTASVMTAAETSSTAVAETVDEISAVESHNSEMTAVDNQAGALVYDKIFPNADLEYIVTGSSIKENVVVYQPQSEYTYTFDMNLGGLIPVAMEDGSYYIVDKAKPDEIVFVLAAPYMYDANGEESYGVEMSLTANAGNYLLTLTADKAWINSSERAFPVVIDPTLDFEFNDVFVIDGLYADSTRVTSELRVGRNLTNLTRTYIKPTVPENIPTGAVIENAQLVLHRDDYYESSSAGDIVIFAYDCRHVEGWSAETLTWNNQPFDNSDNGYLNDTSTGVAYCPAYSSSDTYTFNLKSVAQRWIQTGTAEGIMLASSDETEKVQVDFYSSRALLDSNKPTFEYTYTLPGVNTDTASFKSSAAATSGEIAITTSEAWTITVDQPWISASKASGTCSSTFTISVTENTSANQREGKVRVWIGTDIIGTVTVTQFGTDPALIVDKTSWTVDVSGGTTNIGVSTNVTGTENVLSVKSKPEWLTVTPTEDSITITATENTTQTTDESGETVTVENPTRNGTIVLQLSEYTDVTVEIKVTQYDTVTSYFCNIAEDGTITQKSSSEYNHALATWAMELSYAAYNYPSGAELPGIPGWFMGDVNNTAGELLLTHGFAETQIEEYNYDVIYDEESEEYDRDPTAAGAHTIAYRDIEYVTQNENITDEEENNNGNNTDLVRSTVRGDLYGSIYTDISNSGGTGSPVQLVEELQSNTKKLVVVAIRGSVTREDWFNNVLTQLYPLDNKFDDLKDTVKENLTSFVPNLSDSIVLVTGHSLGAAIANLLAAELSSSLGIENVYAYTFATPQVVTESLGQEAIPYGNIFNILNSNDVVTYMPTTLIVPLANFWSRHGIDIPLNIPYDESLFTDPTGALCHSMAVYMAWMENNEGITQAEIMAQSAQSRTRGILPWIVRIKCPVGVTIKDSEGEIIAYESQEDGITYPEITDTGIVSWIDEDGAKVFFIPHYADASKIEIDAYDYGNMTMSIGLLGVEETDETDTTDEAEETVEALNSITYNNVNLFPGRAFDVDLTEITEEVSMDDISLMEVEVDESGGRTTTGEITELDSYLKSVTIDNPEVTYGTTSTITVVTDKDAVKIQFIYRATGVTMTLTENSEVVTNVAEDGDTLVWTVQKAFMRGEHEFDVAVKMDSTWYTTEKVFALTVT